MVASFTAARLVGGCATIGACEAIPPAWLEASSTAEVRACGKSDSAACMGSCDKSASSTHLGSAEDVASLTDIAQFGREVQPPEPESSIFGVHYFGFFFQNSGDLV
jgi:hypothetical protein